MPDPGSLMFAKLKPAVFQGLLWQHPYQMCGMENGFICSAQWTELKAVLLAVANTIFTDSNY